MKLPDKKMPAAVSLNLIRFLLYGPPKIGKTNLFAGFPNTLFLATEKGYSALSIYVIDIKSWDNFCRAVNLITTTKHSYKTIAIDTLDILWNLCVSYMCDKLEIEHLSDEDWGKAYDMATKEFEREINKLCLTDYGILMSSHTKTSEITSKVGKTTKIQPSLPNQARRIIIPKVDAIGYMYLKTIKLDKDNYVDRRVISFEPTEYIEAGDRHGKLPKELRTYKDPKKTYAEFEKYYSNKGGASKDSEE